MKRHAITLLLSTALLTNMSACTIVPDDTDGNKTPTDVNLSESIVGDTDEPVTDTVTEENRPADDESGYLGLSSSGPFSCNGKSSSDEVRLLYDKENPTVCRYFYIRTWEEYCVLNQEPVIRSGQYCAAVYENKAWLVFFEENGMLTIHLFQKGSPHYTTVQKSVEPDYFENIFCYFLNENVGYLFGIGERIGGYDSGYVLDLLLKTEDGGQTWEQTAVQESPVVSWHEPVEFVKMLDEQVGILSGRCFADDFNFCERTFITTDAGVTWSSLPRIPEFDAGYSEVHLEDLRREAGRYVLTVRYGGNEYRFFSFYSTDLKSWTKLES